MSHVTHINESCHTYEWVMSHIWMSQVTHMNESCHTYEWVMSRIGMSHVTRINHTEVCVISQIWMSHGMGVMPREPQWGMNHVTHMHETCHTSESWVMPHKWVSRVIMGEPWWGPLQLLSIHFTHMGKSCHMYWPQVTKFEAISHIRVYSRDTCQNMNESCHIYELCHTNECVMSHIQIGATVWLLRFVCVTWHLYIHMYIWISAYVHICK